MTPRPSPWLVRLSAVASLAALTGCAVLAPDDGPPRPPTDDAGRPVALSLPCDDGEVSDLGRPFVQQDPALLTTTGGTAYFSVTGFEKGGLFDPETGRAALLLGPATDLPTYETTSGAVPQASVRSSVVEDTWTGIDLAPGRYWVWVTNGSEVSVLTCGTGEVTEVTEVTPAGAP